MPRKPRRKRHPEVETRPNSERSEADRFRAVLLAEKIRGGVLLSSIGAALREVLVRAIVSRHHAHALERARRDAAGHPATRTT